MRLSLKFLAVILFLFAVQMGVSWYFMWGRYTPKQSSRTLQMLPDTKSGDDKGESDVRLAKHLGLVDMISQLEKLGKSDHSLQNGVDLRLVHSTTTAAAKSRSIHTESLRLEIPGNSLTKSAFNAKPSYPEIHTTMVHSRTPPPNVHTTLTASSKTTPRTKQNYTPQFLLWTPRTQGLEKPPTKLGRKEHFAMSSSQRRFS